MRLFINFIFHQFSRSFHQVIFGGNYDIDFEVYGIEDELLYERRGYGDQFGS